MSRGKLFTNKSLLPGFQPLLLNSTFREKYACPVPFQVSFHTNLSFWKNPKYITIFLFDTQMSDAFRLLKIYII